MYKILSLIVCIISGSLIAVSETKALKPLEVGSLAINNLIGDVQQHVTKHLRGIVQESGSDAEKGRFFAALKLIHEAQTLLQDIVNDVNRGCLAQYYDLKQRFITTCNVLKEIKFGDIEPYNLREQVHKTKLFNVYMVKFYMTRREFLNAADFAIFNKMMHFNQIVIFCCTQDEFFDLSIADTVVDWCIRRPGAFIYEYRWPLLGTALVIGAGMYFYYYGISEHYGSGPHVIKNIPGRAQYGRECGFNAAVHAAHMAGARSEDEVRARLQGVKQIPIDEFNRMRRDFEAFRVAADRGHATGINDLTNFEIENALHNGALGDVGRVIPVVERIDQLDRRVLVADDFDALPSVFRFQTGLEAFHEREEPQTLVVRDGAHWIALHIMSDATQPGGVRAVATNSVWGNLADAVVIRDLVARYAQPQVQELG